MNSWHTEIEHGRRFLATRASPENSLHVALVGSHLYGFPSADSDLDLKGIHIAPTDAFLGLDVVVPAFDRLEVFDGLECDLTTQEIGQALSLLLAGNGNVLERLFSPFQLLADCQELSELRAFARESLSKRAYRHYSGFFRGMKREHERRNSAKTMLYTLRVSLTGIHLLCSGEVESNVLQLADEYGYPEIHELVAFKQSSTEKGPLPATQDERFRALWPSLEARLDAALEQSQLPDEPSNRAELNEWLIALRKRDVWRR